MTRQNPEKFNKEFNGIGPKVYIIPPPKTENELITERYALKKESQHQLDSLLIKLNLKKELKTFKLQTPPLAQWDSIAMLGVESTLLAGIRYYQDQNTLNTQANWQNNLAVYYLLNNRSELAHGQLYAASETKNEIGSEEDQLIVLNNLAILELKNGNTIQALAIYDLLLARAKKTKNTDHQINVYLSLARLEANLGNFTDAHNLIIKKSMPLLKRNKNYPQIVNALNELASFKEMQKSDTEAKWIYLQAIEVARERNDEIGLAISLLHLAQLKNRIEDVKLAITDYNEAKDIAIKHKMEDLLVEIHDGLGDAYLKLRDFQAADLMLSEYQLLKTDLLLQNHSTIQVSTNQ